MAGQSRDSLFKRLAGRSAKPDRPVPVSRRTFIRAETDRHLAKFVARGGLGTFDHLRAPVAINQQDVIRTNRDTLYSGAVFDLTTPVTIHMPKTQGRFQSLQAIDQDHYIVAIAHEPGAYTFDLDRVGTRYLFVGIRTFMDPTSMADITAANALQDAIRVDQADPGIFTVPNWDTVSLDRRRQRLNRIAALFGGTSSSRGVFGARGEVRPLRHLVGTAVGWAGNPEQAATYDMVFPKQNDGTTPHALTVSDVPVDGFWSITVYNKHGYMEPNPLGLYSVNNVTAHADPDGRVTVQFRGCGDGRANCLPIMAGWNYVVRLYRPRPEVLTGQWRFPAAQPVG